MRNGKHWRRLSLAGRLCVLAGLLLATALQGQIRRTAPVIGLRQNPPRVHAFVNARIVQAPGKVLERGILVVRDGVIEAVGPKVAVPADAKVWDLKGLTVYPAFVDPYSHVGLPESGASPGKGARRARQALASFGGARHWNSRVHPERLAAERLRPSEKEFAALRRSGIAAVLVVPRKGIFRGTSALVLLGSGNPRDLILRERVAQHLAFEHGGFGDRSYPVSLMGAIALIRQTFLDADWYRRAWEAYRLQPEGQEPPEVNVSLEALQKALRENLPVVFEVNNDQDFLRAARIYREFGLHGWIRGSGYEYRRAKLIRRTGLPVAVPVNFPEAPDVSTVEKALNVSLVRLVHWEAAPENALHLSEAGVPFAFTADGLKKPESFLQNVRKAVARGLPEEAALRALTEQPAELLGASEQLGDLAPGKLANFLITSGDIFQEKTKLYETWVAGERFVNLRRPETEVRGTWRLSLQFPGGVSVGGKLALSGDLQRLEGKLSFGGKTYKLRRIKLVNRRLSFLLTLDTLQVRGVTQMSGVVEKDTIRGYGVLPDGRKLVWMGTWLEPLKPKREKVRKPKKQERAPLRFARGAFVRDNLPPQPEYVLVKNATIWTEGPQGILKQADLLIERGKIARIGRNLKAPKGAQVIDATGKHVTPGLIDEHSHTAIAGGVNEGTHIVTPEVRIQDVLNPDDIAIYRELAGGLTMAHPYHGSANAIGGQDAVIKLRWGVSSPWDLLFKHARPGVKFALGENPKQSNWGNLTNPRYPQTRMGVEQIIRDAFKAALDYQKEWETYRRLKHKKGVVPPRRDLRLEALLEIVQGRRDIHSHAYRQDEMLMLMHVAEDFGIRVRTFEHGLEAYKIASEIAKHGAGVSSFSDWWAYKFEVYDAIPYNGPLLNRAGVVVSYNSDSNELARRLNTEAGKAVKYGGLKPAEALKFVTLNPAKQLGIDRWVGSLEPGKDADFVIWSGPPLSYFSVCEQTWVDGRKVFDRNEDLRLRKEVDKERARIIQKILARPKKKKPGQKPGKGN